MFFQGRGNVYLQPLDADFNPGPAIKLCTDTFQVKPTSQSWSHVNKCGPVDVEDARGLQSEAVSVSMTLADLQDKIFAFGVFGTVNPEGSPGTVTGEQLPADIVAGDVWFLGGRTRHRNITGLTISGLVADTDYTLDAVSGKVTFLNAGGSPAPTADYGYTDPAYVSIFTAPQREFLLSYEFINKQNANAPGSVELYRVRFDAADNLDFQSDKEQDMVLNGSALADTSRPIDTELGQFGRRIGV